MTDSTKLITATKMANCHASRGRSLGSAIARTAPARGTSTNSRRDTWSKLPMVKIYGPSFPRTQESRAHLLNWITDSGENRNDEIAPG